MNFFLFLINPIAYCEFSPFKKATAFRKIIKLFSGSLGWNLQLYGKAVVPQKAVFRKRPFYGTPVQNPLIFDFSE
jgi:hypothetical protein